MADNPPPKASPPLPSSGTAGRPSSPTTRLPPVQTTSAGKVVVLLSSVAKSVTSATQQLMKLPGTGKLPAAKATPPKDEDPAAASAVPGPSAMTQVKLPPKTNEPALVAMTGKSPALVEKKEPEKVIPPLLPPRRSQPIQMGELKKTGPIPVSAPLPKSTSLPVAAPLPVPASAKYEIKQTGPIQLKTAGAPPLPAKIDLKKTGLIKMQPTTSDNVTPADSIFLQPDEAPARPKPAGWKRLEPGELPAEALNSSELFARSTHAEPKPPATAPVVAPPLLTPRVGEANSTAPQSSPALHPAPVALPHSKPSELPPVTPLHVAPPMTAKGPEAPSEKLPQPHLPEPPKSIEPLVAAPVLVAPPLTPQGSEASSDKLAPPHLPEPAKASASEANPVTKAPALLAPATGHLPVLPPSLPIVKPPENLLKKSAPIVLDAKASQLLRPGNVDAKPALKPAVLPKRAVPLPPETSAQPPPLPIVEAKAVSPVPPAIASIEPAKPLSTSIEETKAVDPASSTRRVKIPLVSVPAKERAAALAALAGAGASAVTSPPLDPSKRPPLPPTRAERAKSRRFRIALVFWLLLAPLAGLLLGLGVQWFARDTRIEGQIIPPAGMTLSDEVWIVSDFRQLAGGIAEDLAEERTPLTQEIQARRDHVQRAQADIAAREERIRLIQDQMQAAKEEINGLVKKSREATQAIWDGQGAAVDSDYQSRLQGLKRAIADRAAAQKLKYEPDPTFPSPEVWANAYRLALYETPPGVDGVKEHQWLGEQMKQWRDFQKTLDNRKEKLREEAAQKKLEPGPRITDLNAKIEDLNQRIDATKSEEVPLKAELQQAQVDLGAAENADASLDEKYYKQLYSLPSENITKHISLRPNGRFTWIEEDVFTQGEKQHRYWLFSRAVRADGRQYWMLAHVNIEKNQKLCVIIDPESFVSTKAVLRPNLSPDEIEQ